MLYLSGIGKRFQTSSAPTSILPVSASCFTFFPENLDFSILLTSEIPVNNKKLQPFTSILFGFWQVFFLSVGKKDLALCMPDRHFSCQWIIFFTWQFIDRYYACQWMLFNDWQVLDLSVNENGNSVCRWQVFYLSTRQRVTVLLPVFGWIPKCLFFCYVNKALDAFYSKKLSGGDCFH